MVASGALDGEPVELVDGLLVHVTPQGADHAALVQRLTVHFAVRADLLRVQMPLAVPGGRPEPDVALTETVTSREHPHTAALVVEVAVTSREDDLIKLPGYAHAGVATVWLVDVNGRVVHVFTDPQSAEPLAQLSFPREASTSFWLEGDPQPSESSTTATTKTFLDVPMAPPPTATRGAKLVTARSPDKRAGANNLSNLFTL